LKRLDCAARRVASFDEQCAAQEKVELSDSCTACSPGLERAKA
jgi:hypothetical protein